MEDGCEIEGGKLELVGPKHTSQPISQRKLEANRQNAQKSTGPKTESGKRQSRRNSIKHGILARAAVLSPQEEKEFERIVTLLRDEYQVTGGHQLLIIQEIAVCLLRKARALGYEVAEIRGNLLRRKLEFEERPNLVPPETRRLAGCLQRAVLDIKRYGNLRSQTADELGSLMAKSDLDLFHRKLAEGLLVNRESTAELPEGEVAKLVKMRRVAVIEEYLEPIATVCQAEDEKIATRDSLCLLPPSDVTNKVLRYLAPLDRVIDRLTQMLLYLRAQERAAQTRDEIA